MIFVGIDIAKDKHDCFISNSDGEVLFNAFTITNSLEGFNDLYLHIARLNGRVCGAKRPHSVSEQPIYTMSR